METTRDMITDYIMVTWYESKCKRRENIEKIVSRELEKRPNYMEMDMDRLCLKIKRICMSEL